MKNYIHTIIHFSLWLVYVILAMSDLDRPSWILMNISIFVGLIGPVLLWAKTSLKIIGFGIAYIKLALNLFFMWGWWELTYSADIVYKGLEFFWGMSPFLLILGIFETLIINNYVIKKNVS